MYSNIKSNDKIYKAYSISYEIHYKFINNEHISTIDIHKPVQNSSKIFNINKYPVSSWRNYHTSTAIFIDVYNLPPTAKETISFNTHYDFFDRLIYFFISFLISR